MRFDKLAVSTFLNKSVVSEIFNLKLILLDKVVVSVFLSKLEVSVVFSLAPTVEVKLVKSVLLAFRSIRLDKLVVSIETPPFPLDKL